MTRHIHAAVLARYRGGDLGERRSRRIAAHLAGCRRCTAASSGLAEVSHLLRAAAAPPMPADITARIEAALAAEAAQPSRAAAPDGQLAAAGTGRALPGARHSGTGPGRGTPASGRPRRPALRSPVALRVLAGTAVAAVIVGGAYTAGQLAGGNSTGSGTSAAAGSSESAGSSKASSSDSPMVRGAAGAAPATSPGPAGGSGGAASSIAGPALKYQAAHGAATFVPVAAKAGFGRSDLASQVRVLLLSAGRRTPLGTPSGASTSRFFSGIPVATLEGCVSRVAAGGRVRLVDVDRYQGSKATIIVVAPAGGGRQQIWVVGPGCSRSDPQVITQATLPAGG